MTPHMLTNRRSSDFMKHAVLLSPLATLLSLLVHATVCGQSAGPLPNPAGQLPNPAGQAPNPTGQVPNPTGQLPNPAGHASSYAIEPSVGPMTNAVWKFQFQNAPWSFVLKQFARTNGMSLQVQALPIGDFTYFDERHYSATEAIDVFNDYLLPSGFLLIRNGNKLTVIPSGSAISDGVVPFVPLARLPKLGRHELASIVVSVKSENPQALIGEVQEFMSSVGRVRALSNSRKLMLTDTGAYLRPAYDLLTGSGIAASDVESFVYKLRHTRAESLAKAVNDRFGEQASGQEVGPSSQGSFAVPELETNSLLLRGSPGELVRLQELISQLDQAPPQVLIQAYLVEVLLGNTDERGVEVGLQDSVLFNRSVVDNILTVSETITSANGVQTTNDRIISQTAAPGFNFNSPILGNNTSVAPGTIGTQGLSTLGVGRTNADLGFGGLVLSAGSESVNVLIRALQANYKIDILSRPQIRTVDNKEAFIQAGQQVPVVDGVSVTANGGANPVVRQDRAGIILRVTPKISPDGAVQLSVAAEKSAFQLTPGNGVPIFTDVTTGNVIEAPVKDVTTVETTVSATSGQTVVLGGLITKETSKVERKVPILGDIPIVRRLFRYDFDDTQRKELLIFLTPHVIVDNHFSDQINLVETDRIHVNHCEVECGYGNQLTTLPTAPTVLGSPQNSVPLYPQMIE